jgi:hypothetical protein
MALITAANVLTRYLSNISLAFTEEYSVALMVVVAMVGTALATAGGRHIRIGFFADKLSPNRRRIAEIMALGLLIICFALILWYGARMVWDGCLPIRPRFRCFLARASLPRASGPRRCACWPRSPPRPLIARAWRCVFQSPRRSSLLSR